MPGLQSKQVQPKQQSIKEDAKVSVPDNGNSVNGFMKGIGSRFKLK
jgi:hypothetical protein